MSADRAYIDSYAIHMLFLCYSYAIHMLFICHSYDIYLVVSCHDFVLTPIFGDTLITLL